MKLQNKIVLTVVTAFIVSLLFMGMLVFTNSKESLQKSVVNQLESLSNVIEEDIGSFILGQENKLKLIADQSELSNDELSKMIVIDDSFYELFVIDSSGIVIASSNMNNVGLEYSSNDFFTKARNDTYFGPASLSNVTNQHSFTVSVPFHKGVLVGRTDLTYLNKITSNRIGLGETGESLMAYVNDQKEIIYFSERRFSDNIFETLSEEKASQRPIYRATQGEETVLFGLKDYRDVVVISSTRFIEELNFGLVTKIDEAEAFASVYTLQKVIILITCITLILISLIVLFVARSVSQEIKEVTNDITEITKGNLEIQLKKSNIDEIGSLADSLNRILASMKLAILRTNISKEELGVGEAVKAKKEIEDRYKIIYEGSADAIMTLEPPTWKFTSANPATIKMFDAKSEQNFTTKGPWGISPKNQPNGKSSAVEAKKMIEKAMKEGSSLFEWTHRKLSGEEFPATVLLSRIKINDKEILQATIRQRHQVKDLKEELMNLKNGKKSEKKR